MNVIANIIVDVPSRQTDRPFDYKVPKSLQPWIELGSRVGVPFGPRVLQGVVVGLAEESEYDHSKLKPIKELLDPEPPLLPDLIELSKWLSEKYCCSRIAALQIMLPSALKGKEVKYIALSGAEQEQAYANSAWLQALRQEDGAIKLEKLMAMFPEEHRSIKQALQQGLLTLSGKVKDRTGIKQVRMVLPPADPEAAREQLAALKKQARKQYEVLSYLLEHPEPIALAQLVAKLNTSSSVVQGLAGKELVRIEDVEQKRDPYRHRQFEPSSPLPLTELQRHVYERIVKEMERKSGQTMLLHGVTGSGKTEVYLQSIAQCLDSNRQAIVLVPEISLTPQMVERFKSRFGDAVAVMHSRLSDGERYDEWRKIRHGQARVVVGARSAIFAPFSSIGLIIIDEEHESSYKQDETPKYHARDVAVRRAKQHGAVVLLGSATPSLETFVAASRIPKGAAEAPLLSMPERVAGQAMPTVHIIDMRQELTQGNRSMFSSALYEALKQRLERQEQTVLLLNRRGYSTFVMCRSCGYTASCPHCDISLTYHQKTRLLRCHYCGHAEQEPKQCPQCESEHIRFFGTGTQKVEEELAKLFPGIRVIRMDVDTTTEKNAHEKLLKTFSERKADVLLGTQMVAKGLDFPYVTLVGVIAADTTLNLPDFRAAERTFQLLTQVAGRAGRHHLQGEVMIQTYNPEHYAVQAAAQHHYEQFIQQELELRMGMMYPPYCRLICITMSAERLDQLAEVSTRFVNELKEIAQYEGVLVPLQSRMARAMEILGPVASPLARIKDRYRYQCVIKYRGSIDASTLVERAMEPFVAGKTSKQVLFSVDVDPQVIV
ncbi:primosomal protein N' [Paenibacillus montaniterrae]|uniref:primosomal protein N' n=1 Tax=Paenibacillus montaniterrae TaxID=429341 RepID=UPI001FE55ECD|nr:primosomal protein N' [Paenibacillus montaniterrae]